jgi:integrase
MASICNDPGGRKRILFVGGDGNRYPIRLGKMNRKAAMAINTKIEHLVSASITGHPIDGEVSQWVSGLDDVIADKLAAVGLIPPRESSRLGLWLEKYITSRSDLKPASRVKLEQTRDKLLGWFDADIPLRKVTADGAANWRQCLIDHGASKATVKTHIGNAKTMFNAAVDRELIPRSPFDKLKGGATASANDRYITPEETRKLLDAAPDLRYRVLIGLARLAGLRTPSETHLLTWGDVDWQRGRLTVRSPKTEHHEGKEQRIVPITPTLLTILQDTFDAAKEGQQRIVTLGRGGNVRRVVERIIKQSGVMPWPGLWQTLRQSCEKHWAMDHPQYAVSQWLGHSIAVSGKHYANAVPDELFDRVATVDAQAAHNPAQQPSASGRNGSQDESGESTKPAFCGCERDIAATCETEIRVSEGIRTPDPRDHNAVL